MCEWIKDIIIGIISGGISSWIVSIALKKYWDTKEHKKNFEANKQTYLRYIQNIRIELLLAYKSGDNDYLIRAIEDEPIRESFLKLTDESNKRIQEVNEFIQKLKQEAMTNSFTEAQFKIKYGKLYQYSVWVIKLTEDK